MDQAYGIDPKTARGRRRLRTTGVTMLALAAAITVLFLTGIIRIYNGENAGIVVGWPCHNVGFEWRGAPGDPALFDDAC